MKKRKINFFSNCAIIILFTISLTACSSSDTSQENSSLSEVKQEQHNDESSSVSQINVDTNQTFNDFTENKLKSFKNTFETIEYKETDNKKAFYSNLDKKTILGEEVQDYLFAIVNTNEETSQAEAYVECEYYVHKDDDLDKNDKTLKAIYDLVKTMPSSNIKDIKYDEFINMIGNSSSQIDNVFGGSGTITRMSDRIIVRLEENSDFALEHYTPKDYTYDEMLISYKKFNEDILAAVTDIAKEYGYYIIQEENIPCIGISEEDDPLRGNILTISTNNTYNEPIVFDVYYNIDLDSGYIQYEHDVKLYNDVVKAIIPIISEFTGYEINLSEVESNSKSCIEIENNTNINGISPFSLKRHSTDQFNRNVRISVGGYNCVINIPITIDGKSSK